MYYFIKKTGELVKRKNIPISQKSKQKINGIYIQILLGENKDKSFFIYSNQLEITHESTKLNHFEIQCLKQTKNEKEWNILCGIIKSSRNGNYPIDWIETLKKENITFSGETTQSSEPLTDQSTPNFMDLLINNMFKNLIAKKGFEKEKEKNKNHSSSSSIGDSSSGEVPTIIFIDGNISDIIQKKKEKKNDSDDSENKIYFPTQKKGCNVFEKIDFLSRFDITSLIEPQKKIQIDKGSSFHFLYPFPKSFVIQNTIAISNRKSLLTWILENCQKNQNLLIDNFTYEDLGLDHVFKKKDKNYEIIFLY